MSFFNRFFNELSFDEKSKCFRRRGFFGKFGKFGKFRKFRKLRDFQGYTVKLLSTKSEKVLVTRGESLEPARI